MTQLEGERLDKPFPAMRLEPGAGKQPPKVVGALDLLLQLGGLDQLLDYVMHALGREPVATLATKQRAGMAPTGHDVRYNVLPRDFIKTHLARLVALGI